MKKIISATFVLALGVQTLAFAQYGWSAYYPVSVGWSTSFALTRDICTNGDKSPSFFDGSCGDMVDSETVSDELLVTGPRRVLDIPSSSDVIVVTEDNLVTPDSLPDTGVTAWSATRVLRIISNNTPTPVIDWFSLPATLPQTGTR